MNITIGNVVRNDDFFDREQLLDDLWAILETDSVLLAAPRRVGKTSIMHKLIDSPVPGYRVLFLDGQDYLNAEDLVTDLIIKTGRLFGDAMPFIRRVLTSIEEKIDEVEVWQLKVKLRHEVVGRWREEGERAVREALRHEGRLLIILDELPVMLHKMVTQGGSDGKQSARDLLDWLRYLRLNPEFNLRLRQIAGGSIGLPRIASMIDASHKINDLRQVEVGPLTPDAAAQLAEQLLWSRNVKIDAASMRALLAKINPPLPIYVQIMSSILATEVRKRGVTATPDLVNECYEQRAMSPEFRLCFEDLFERLGRYYTPDEARGARRIIRDLALSDGPLSRSALFMAFREEIGEHAQQSDFEMLLNWLTNDFYIEEIEGGSKIAFRDTWLKDWWRRYHASRS